MSDSLVLYSEAKFLVCSKPSGITTYDFVDVIEDLFPIHAQEVTGTSAFKYDPVHRLDKATSGCLIVSRHKDECHRLTEAFKKRKVKKQYLAIVCGRPADDFGRIDVALHVQNLEDNGNTYSHTIVHPQGKEAITHYEVLYTNGDYSLLKLQPVTGRTHQLRAHCQSVLNTPILGDRKYNPFHESDDQEMFLHAYKIAIPQGSTDRMVEFTAPLPPNMAKTINAIAGLNMVRELGLQ